MIEARDTAAVRRLNDALRVAHLGGRVHITKGIAGLGADGVAEVVSAVATFDAFCEDNDPWGEHDCAVLEVSGRRVIFKIDYYDASLTAGSEDPANPHVTCRVLTIMLSREY